MFKGLFEGLDDGGSVCVVWDKKTTPDLMFLSSKQTDS